jgi:hypothetical protein
MKIKSILGVLLVMMFVLALQSSLFALTERTVASVADMTNLTGLTNGDLTNVSSGTGIDGQFRFAYGSAATIDNALIFSANGGRWIRVYSEGLNVKWFGAVGNGSNNDTTAIQACIDCASTKQAKMFFPNGVYKITSPLDIKSNVSMSGQGRNFGTVIVPTNCYAFKIDGTDKAGGWVFRIRISDMIVQGDATSDAYGTSLIKVINAYNVEMARVWVYNQETSSGIEITGCNAITLEDCIAYGLNSSIPRAIYIHDGATVRVVRPDIENYYCGIILSGEVVTSIESPYSERCIINVLHGTTGSGATTITGGYLSSVNGYCLKVQSNNFILKDTVLESINGETLNGYVAYVSTTTLANNVKIEPANDYNGATNDTYLNYAAVDLVKNIADMKSGKIEFKTTAADNVLTDLFSFSGCDTLKVKLTLCAAKSNAHAIKTFEFMIDSSVITASPVTTTVINEYNGSYNIAMTPSVSYAGGVATVSVTSNQSGISLEGQSVTVFGSLEYTLIDSGTCTIRRLAD